MVSAMALADAELRFGRGPRRICTHPVKTLICCHPSSAHREKSSCTCTTSQNKRKTLPGARTTMAPIRQEMVVCVVCLSLLPVFGEEREALVGAPLIPGEHQKSIFDNKEHSKKKQYWVSFFSFFVPSWCRSPKFLTCCILNPSATAGPTSAMPPSVGRGSFWWCLKAGTLKNVPPPFVLPPFWGPTFSGFGPFLPPFFMLQQLTLPYGRNLQRREDITKQPEQTDCCKWITCRLAQHVGSKWS